MRTKFLLLLTILFSVTITSNAQISQGRYLLGGSFGISGIKSDLSSADVKNEFLNASLQFGKVVKENTVVGLISSYGYNNYYVNTVNESTYDQYSAGMFYRKYSSVLKKVYLFGEANVTYFHSTLKQGFNQPNNSGTKTISNGVSANFIPGVSYAISKRIQAELVMLNIVSASYSQAKVRYPAANPSSNPGYSEKSFSFNTNFNANLLSNFGIGFKFFPGR